MVDLKAFPYVKVISKTINYENFTDKKSSNENLIHNLTFRVNDETDLSSCIPDKKMQIENLAIEYTPEGKKRFASKSNLWKTKFLTITNSLTLIDCYFGTENFKAEKLKNDWIFRNIKELNLFINEIPSISELEELLKMSPELERIDFGEIRLNRDLLNTILNYKNITTISCRGTELKLDGLLLKDGKLNINLSTFKEIEQIKSVLNTGIEVMLEISDSIEITSMEEILNNVTLVSFNNSNITNEDLELFINKCPNLKELSINQCKNLSNIESILDNENLQKVIVDGKKIKEHIIIHVPQNSNDFRNNSIATQTEIDTLELIISNNKICSNSINCSNELVINNLIIRNMGEDVFQKNIRAGLLSTSRIKINTVYLDNLFFTNFNSNDEIYKDTKRIITTVDKISKGGALDQFLSYASNIEEIEFTNLELDYNILGILIPHNNVKKIICNGIEFHLEGFTIANKKVNINLDIFEDIDVILELIKKENIEIEVEFSDVTKILSLEKISPYMQKLNLQKSEITEENLIKILNISKNLTELTMQDCKKIQKIEGIEKYDQLTLVELDKKDLLQIPGVNITRQYNSYNDDTIIVNLKEYSGSPIRVSKYEKVNSLQIIISLNTNIEDIKIIGANRITKIEIVNSNTDEIIQFTQETEKFLSLFTELKAISFDNCDLDFNILKNLENLENLENLSINNSNLNNASLKPLPQICKELTHISITNCKNLTDVSTLAQLERISVIDVSNNRICKGIDLLINYLPITNLKACNNLITNDQIEYLFQSRTLSRVDLSRNPITNIVVPTGYTHTIFLTLNDCLLSTLMTNDKFKLVNDNEIKVGKNDYNLSKTKKRF